MFGRFITRQKRSFQLLEVMIALGLLTILLGSLAFMQKRIYYSRKQQDQVYKTFLDEYRAYTVLRSIFCCAQNIRIVSNAEQGDAVCSFIFDRGVSRNPELSGEVRGDLIFSSKDKNIRLMIYNLSEPNKNECIIVLDHVTHSDFILTNDTIRTMIIKLVRETLGKERLLEYPFICEA